MIHLLFLAHNRLEFTKACVAALIANTDWSLVRHVWCYDDFSSDGTKAYLQSLTWPVESTLYLKKLYGPVAIMNHFLQLAKPEMFAKIDNDTIVPPGWLNACLDVMDASPELELLGIECGHDNPEMAGPRSYRRAHHIGGIGLMRAEVFSKYGLPRPDGRMGFTAWQERNDVHAGWLEPPLPVALLDHLPMEPWRSLSALYVRNGWQRQPWGFYEQKSSKLWEWWEGAAQPTC
jgi:hypothetical protein